MPFDVNLVHSAPGSSIPGRAATMPVMGSSSSWRATLWTRLEKLADSIEHIFVKVQQFQVVLERKKDPTSGESLFDKIRDVSIYCGCCVNIVCIALQ